MANDNLSAHEEDDSTRNNSVVDEQDQETRNIVKKIEAESKATFIFREKTVSLARLKCTNFKYNKRLHLPEPTSSEREAMHHMRKEEMMNTFITVTKKSDRKNSQYNKKEKAKSTLNEINSIKRQIEKEIMKNDTTADASTCAGNVEKPRGLTASAQRCQTEEVSSAAPIESGSARAELRQGDRDGGQVKLNKKIGDNKICNINGISKEQFQFVKV